MEDYANEHGTPAQRAYNAMCIAYGADAKLFSDFVNQGYLPKGRAEFCEDEYFQIQDAFEILVHPHLDFDLAEKILDRAWVCESDGRSALHQPRASFILRPAPIRTTPLATERRTPL